jgi:hypothetical protein
MALMIGMDRDWSGAMANTKPATAAEEHHELGTDKHKIRLQLKYQEVWKMPREVASIMDGSEAQQGSAHRSFRYSSFFSS